MPTAGHKAIAQMVAKGYFRVIITTKFDRLMEQALDAEGVSPLLSRHLTWSEVLFRSRTQRVP